MKVKINFWLIIPLAFHVTVAEAESSYLEKLRSEVDELRADVVERGNEAEAVLKAGDNLEVAKKEIAETKEAIVKKEQSIKDKEFLLSAYKKGFRVATSIPRGHSFGTFSYQGRSLQNCVFLGVNGNGVSLQTSGGMLTVPFSELPPAWATGFTLPSVTSEPATEFVQVYRTKPAILRTQEEMQLSKQTSTGNVGEATSSTDSSVTDSPVSVPVKDEAQLIRERNTARMKEINELRIQYSSLFNERKKAKQDKYRQEQEFRSAKIKKSQNHIDEVMGEIDARINSLEEKERELKNKMARLRASME